MNEDQEEHNKGGDAPRRASAAVRLAVHGGLTATIERVVAEEAGGLLHGGQPAHDDEEGNGDDEEGPVGGVLDGFDGFFVIGGPLEAQKDEDDGEDQKDRVGQRAQGEAIEER